MWMPADASADEPAREVQYLRQHRSPLSDVPVVHRKGTKETRAACTRLPGVVSAR